MNFVTRFLGYDLVSSPSTQNTELHLSSWICIFSLVDTMMLDNYSFKNRYLLSLSTAPTGMDNKRFFRYHKSHPWALPEPPESRLSFFIACNIFSSSGSDYAYFYNHVSATNTTAADLTDTGIFLLSYTGSHSRRQETSLSFSVTLRLFWDGRGR